MGLQKKASYYTIACYWIVAVPLACVFVFVLNFGAKCLWFSLILGCLLQSSGFVVIVLSQDW